MTETRDRFYSFGRDEALTGRSRLNVTTAARQFMDVGGEVQALLEIRQGNITLHCARFKMGTFFVSRKEKEFVVDGCGCKSLILCATQKANHMF